MSSVAAAKRLPVALLSAPQKLLVLELLDRGCCVSPSIAEAREQVKGL